MDYSIIIPVYNSEHSIIELYDTLQVFFKNKDYEIIFVDDCSRDKSYSVITSLAQVHPQVKAVRLEKNYGQQRAIFCGMFYASGDFIITMDDDLQHSIHYLSHMFAMIESGNDLVYGVLPIAKIKSIRNLGTHLRESFFRKNFEILNGKRVSSFRIFNRRLLLKALGCEYAFIYLSPLLLKEAQSIGNIIMSNNKRKYGKSGYTIRKLGRLYILLNIYYSKYSIDLFKKKGGTFFIQDLININEVKNHKKNNDTRGWQLSVRGH